MASGRPTGMVTFLLSDVQGSAAMWDRDPAGMAESLAMHDRTMRDAIEHHGGYIFSTAGDSFAAAFTTPSSASGAALAAQIDLAAAEWPGPPLTVRIGLDTGEAFERDGGYFGRVVNRAARLQEAAAGGQILLSEATAHLLRDGLPERASLLDLGRHRLRDLAEPEQVHTLAHPSLPEAAAPLRTASDPGHNLPTPLTSFVGRDAESAAIGELLEQQRLVTITGAGGVGKTRLALEVARRLIERFNDGVWFIDLRGQTTDSVVTACAQTLQVRAGEGVLSTRQALVRALTARDTLLIIDNCEHVLDTVRDLVSELLTSTQGAHVLATSQATLHVPGERLIRLEPLGTSAAGRQSVTEAAAMLIERAQEVRPGFDPDGAELEAINDVARKVDGIPLALELAAARLRVLSPADLLHRLDLSFQVLRDEKAADPRHRALTSTIDASHRSLEPSRQATFRQLSVFVGGFDLAAANAVCGGQDHGSGGVLDDIEALVDNSLIGVEHGQRETTRLRMLEPVREFAADQLRASGEQRTVADRHAKYYEQLVAEAFSEIRGPRQAEWDTRLEAEQENIRALLSRLLERDEPEAYLATCFRLEFHWRHRALQVEALDLISKGLTRAEEVRPLVQVKALVAASMLANDVLHPAAVEFAERAHRVATEAGDEGATARAAIALGACRTHKTGMTEFVGADLVASGGETLARDPEPWWWEPAWEIAYWTVLRAAYLPASHPSQATLQSQSIEMARATGDAALTAYALMVAFRGDPDDVNDRLAEAIELGRHHGLRSTLGLALLYSGAFARLRGQAGTASDRLSEAQRLLQDFGGHFSASVAAALLVPAHLAMGRLEAAIENLRALVASEPPDELTGHLLAAATLVASAIGDGAGAIRFKGAAERHLASNFITRDEIDEATAVLVPEQDVELTAKGASMGVREARAAVGAWIGSVAAMRGRGPGT